MESRATLRTTLRHRDVELLAYTDRYLVHCLDTGKYREMTKLSSLLSKSQVEMIIREVKKKYNIK